MKPTIVAAASTLVLCVVCFAAGAYVSTLAYKLGRLDCLMEQAP